MDRLDLWDRPPLKDGSRFRARRRPAFAQIFSHPWGQREIESDAKQTRNASSFASRVTRVRALRVGLLGGKYWEGEFDKSERPQLDGRRSGRSARAAFYLLPFCAKARDAGKG